VIECPIAQSPTARTMRLAVVLLLGSACGIERFGGSFGERLRIPSWLGRWGEARQEVAAPVAVPARVSRASRVGQAGGGCMGGGQTGVCGTPAACSSGTVHNGRCSGNNQNVCCVASAPAPVAVPPPPQLTPPSSARDGQSCDQASSCSSGVCRGGTCCGPKGRSTG
jgi:hypothetical protein